MCHFRSIDYNEWYRMFIVGEPCVCMGRGYIGTLYFLLNFFYKPTTALKMNSISLKIINRKDRR